MIALWIPDIVIVPFLCCALVIESQMRDCPPLTQNEDTRELPSTAKVLLRCVSDMCVCESERNNVFVTCSSMEGGCLLDYRNNAKCLLHSFYKCRYTDKSCTSAK